MHITLNLTSNCNMQCNYCYAKPFKSIDMTDEIAFKAIDFGYATESHNLGIIFFGGEPLLKKDLIIKSVQYANSLFKKNGFSIHYKITTNGLLLNEEFIDYCTKVKIAIALSFDGIKEAHNTHRVTKTNQATFHQVEKKLDLLLKYQPYANVYMTVTPETLQYYADSVLYLLNKNVKYIIASLNYAGKWTDEHLYELKRQYKILANIYEDFTLSQKKFYFSPFEMKLSSHIKGEFAACEKCHLGINQVSISPEGFIYPCVQFVGHDEYKIGSVWHGIDNPKRNKLYQISQSHENCTECKINSRCNNSCSCLNFQTTGMINSISPFLCESEKILTPIVDKLGNKLFKNRTPMFIQKHYNTVYPIISLLEDLN